MLTVDFRKHSGPTPADDMAAQIITDCGNFTLDFKQHGFCASAFFLQTLGPWFPNEMQHLLSSENGPLINSPVILLFSPGKMLLTMFLFQKWLGSPFPEDVWAWWLLMHWLQLQFTACEALPSVWISFAWQYSQVCDHPCCLCTFSYPISSFQSSLHLQFLKNRYDNVSNTSNNFPKLLTHQHTYNTQFTKQLISCSKSHIAN